LVVSIQIDRECAPHRPTRLRKQLLLGWLSEGSVANSKSRPQNGKQKNGVSRIGTSQQFISRLQDRGSVFENGQISGEFGWLRNRKASIARGSSETGVAI